MWEMPLVDPDWTVMALDKILSHPNVFLFEDCRGRGCKGKETKGLTKDGKT
jgi:hypothetical protein